MNSALCPSLPSRFVNARFIGEGAMGVVYDVWDLERQERLALKTLHKATPTDIREFKREFRTMASLSHPNLVALHELFCEDGLWFFTMELVLGKPLVDTARATRKRWTEKALREHFLQLAHAIGALHHAGVLHRDIKPDNVLVEDSGRVVLLDFGLVAALRSELTYQDAEYVLAGSPGYMPPEQILGQPLSPASDWYSFGVTLYEALTGALPYEDKSGSTILRKLNGEPTPLRQFNVSVSPELEQLCLRLLSREAAQRPDADEICRVLGTPSQLPRPSSVRPSPFESEEPVVGRDTELDIVCPWLASRHEGPRVVVLRGPSGMGKTTLAKAALSRLDTPDAWLVRSRCMPQEAVPFNAWDGIVDELCDALHRRESELGPLPIDPILPRLFPVLGSLNGVVSEWQDETFDPIEARTEGMHALRLLMRALSSERPLFLFIDDIQWADADSLRLLREVVTSSTPPTLGLVVTMRSDLDDPPAFEKLIAESEFGSACRVVDVGPLPEPQAAELLLQLGISDDRVQRRVLGEARGNPFLLSQLARWDETRPPRATVKLRSVLRHRLETLPPEAQQLFEVIGLVGRPVPLDVALEAAGITVGGLEAIHRLRAAGLVRLGASERKEVETYHDRWRAALAELVGPDQRQARFNRLAIAFEQRNLVQDAEVLATCYRECGNSDAAAKYALIAASSAESTLAFDRATRCYETALELGAWDDARRSELLEKLGVMAHAAGRGARAGRAFRQAAELSTGLRRSNLLRQAAQALLSSGRERDGEAVLDEVLASVGSRGPKHPARTIAQLLLEQWRLRRRGLGWTPKALNERQRLRISAHDVVASTWVQHDPIVSWLHAQRQLRLALDGDDPVLLLRAVAHELIFAATEIHNGRWLNALVELGRRLCDRVEDQSAIAWFEHALGMRSFLAGRWLEAEQQLARSLHMLRSRCTAVHWELCVVRRRYIAAVQIVGDMAAPEAELRDWLDDAEQRDDREAIAANLFGLAYCELSKGRPQNVWPLINRVRQLVGEQHDEALGAAWLEAITLCYQQAPVAQLRSSLQRLRDFQRTMQARVPLYRVWSRSYETRVLGALLVQSSGKERDEVVRDMRRLRKRLLRERWDHASCIAQQLAATLELCAGRSERAAAYLDESAASHEAHGAKLFAAVSLHASATIRRHDADLAHAVELLHELHVADPEGLSRAHLPAFYAKQLGSP